MVFPAAHAVPGDNPTSTDVNNGAAITTGVRLTVNASKNCDGIAFFVPGTNTGTYTGKLYETTSDDDPGGTGTGTELSSGSVAAAAVTAGTWARIPLAAQQTLTTGKVYTAAVHSSSGRIVATATRFATSMSGNGVTLLAAGTDPNPPGLGNMTNGVFTEGASPTYPNTSFNNTDYGIDISIATGQSASIGTVTETDTAGTLGRAKARAIGVASTTDTAQALTRRRTYPLGVAGDTATAGALGDTKARALGVAGDTSTAGAVAHAWARTLGVAGDISTALALGKVLGLNTVTQLNTALPITVAGQSTTPIATQRASVVRGPQRAGVARGPQRATVVRDA